MNSQMIGIWLIVVSALSFATFPIFIHYAFTLGINIPTMLAFRFLGATLILWTGLYVRNIPVRVSRKELYLLILMGILGYGSMSTLYSSSLQYITPSMTALLLYLYPAIVSMLSWFTGDDTLDYRKIFAMMVSLMGLGLVLGTNFAGLHSLGVTLAIGAALVYSLYIVAGNRLIRNVSPLVTSAYIFLSAAAFFIVAGFATDKLVLSIPPMGWFVLLGIVVFPTTVAILTFFAGMAHVGPTKASLISTLEPVGTVLLSAWVLGERFTLPQLAGGLLVLGGIILLQVWKAPANEQSTGDVPDPVLRDKQL